MKTYSAEDLDRYNGENGNPAHIAYQGRVYDVTESKRWKAGNHMRRHKAGRDLTQEMQAAPHGAEVLERFPQVGEIKASAKPRYEIPQEIPEFLRSPLQRVPLLRRHPHPMSVHFPIVFLLSAPFFTLLFLIFRTPSLETTAFHCLAGGVGFTVVAVLTGLLTWWVNYERRPIRTVTIKKRCSFLALAFASAALIWRIIDPEVLLRLTGIDLVYLFLVFSLFPLISVTGWYGAILTFPLEKE